MNNPFRWGIVGGAVVFVAVGFIVDWTFLYDILLEMSGDGVLAVSSNQFDLAVFAGIVIVALFITLLIFTWRMLLAGIGAFFQLPHMTYFVIVFSVALGLRVGWNLAVPTEPESDYFVYHELASNVADGTGYIDDFSPIDTADAGKQAYRPAGFPLLLSVVYRITGPAVWAGKALIVLLGTVTLYPTYLLMRTLFGEQVGRVSALITALFPSLITFSSTLNSEIPFTLFFVVGLWGVIAYQQARHNYLLLIMAGISFGICSLTRSVGLLVPGLLLLYLWIWQREFIKPILQIALVGVCMLIVIAPWMIRNMTVLGEPTLSTNGGANLWMGTLHEIGNGDFVDDTDQLPLADRRRLAEIQALDELEQDAAMQAWAIENMIAEPGAYFLYGFEKMRELYLFDYVGTAQAFSGVEAIDIPQPIRYATYGIVQIYYMGVVLLALGGVLVALRHFSSSKAGYWLLMLLIVYVSGVHFVIFGGGRFHYPLLPLFSGLAATLLVYGFSESGRAELKQTTSP